MEIKAVTEAVKALAKTEIKLAKAREKAATNVLAAEIAREEALARLRSLAQE